MLKPRKPTFAEREALLEVSFRNVYGDEEFSSDWIKYAARAAIAVFDEYETDNCDYRGKIMSVVWPDNPYWHEVYRWKNDKLELVDEE